VQLAVRPTGPVNTETRRVRVKDNVLVRVRDVLLLLVS
jgi:hypothetical protein